MQMKHLLLLASLLTCMGAGAQQATFRNPVIAGDMADPTVIRVDNTYYATGTSSEWAPYYPLFRSKDLVNWRQIGHLFEQQPAWTRSSFWAPELFHRNGKTYAYYTARRKTDGTSYIGVATADKPEGPYTDHGPIVEYGTEAIDAFVLETPASYISRGKPTDSTQGRSNSWPAKSRTTGCAWRGNPSRCCATTNGRAWKGSTG